ncbi:hypothetical protein HZA56_22240 [Candidatus Poribacteria bacterium]|nr:hypothetical protein [Candidatus Poribacteria bacterium]
MKTLISVLIVLITFSSTTLADIIVFKTGAAKVGIIVEENPTSVRFRVKDSVLGISRENIERIEYAKPEENKELELKWKADKEKADEARKLKREEEQKFIEEQKAKGLVDFGGKWVTPAEAEAARQESVRQQVQAQQAAQAAAKRPISEETELPAFVRSLPPDQKQAYMERLKRVGLIEISQVRARPQSRNVTLLTGMVTNKSKDYMRRIDLEIQCIGENDQVLFTDTSRVDRLNPDTSGAFNVSVRIDSSLIKRTQVRVVDLTWE